MKTLAIFDLDGTLLNTIDDLATAVNHALEVNNYPTHSIADYRLMVGNGVRRLIERALPADDRSEAIIDKLLADFRLYYDQHLHVFTTPYPGIVDLLEQMRQRGIALAVASNKYESAVRRLISALFPEIEFVAVCGNVEGVPTKPDPSIVFRILADHPTPKADIIYIGDSAVDIETARRTGVTSVGVTWGFRPERELTAALADHIISSPADLLSLL